MKLDASNRPIAGLERLHQVPGNGLTLAVGVSGKDDLIRFLDAALELLHLLELFAWNQIVGLKVPIDIYPQLALGQVSDVAKRGAYLVPGAQIPLNGLGLGR